MMTFTWVPEFGGGKDYVPNVSNIKYGDGYEQRAAKGLNPLSSNWNLTFANREPDESADILAFLEACGGVEAFYWTPPDTATQLIFICQKWGHVPQKGGRFTITAQFEQRFVP